MKLDTRGWKPKTPEKSGLEMSVKQIPSLKFLLQGLTYQWLQGWSKKQVHTVNSLNSNDKAINIKRKWPFQGHVDKNLKQFENQQFQPFENQK